MKIAHLIAAPALVLAALDATVTSSAALVAPAATAAKVADPRGDVELRKAGWNRGMDIEQVRYAKSGENLKTVIKVRDLNATTTDLTQMFYGVTIEINHQTAYFFSNTGHPDVEPTVFRARDGEYIDCPAAKVTLGVAKDLVRITVPLSCLDTPKRIGVKASSVQFVNEDVLVARDYSDPSKVINVG